MKSFISVYTVEEFRKRAFNGGTTETYLRRARWRVPDVGGLSGDLQLSTPDEHTPDHSQIFLVTVEPVKIPEGMHISDFIEQEVPKIIAARTEIISGVKTGRKFR